MNQITTLQEKLDAIDRQIAVLRVHQEAISRREEVFCQAMERISAVNTELLKSIQLLLRPSWVIKDQHR